MDPFIVHQDDLDERDDGYPPPFDAEKLAFSKDLGRAAGSARLGFGVDRLPPGRRTGFTHAHSEEEELVYVLSGTCHVRLLVEGEPPREVPLRAGHAVSFPAGTRVAHTFVNRGTEDCRLLVVGERRPGVDRVFYPEDAAYDAHLAERRPARHWPR